MAKKRKTRRRNPAASERATYGGTMPASARPASAKAASARPVAKPPVDMPLPASAKPAAKKSSPLPKILAAVFGVAAVGGAAWWIFSRRAEAAEAGESDGSFEPSVSSEPYFKLDKPFVLAPEVAEAVASAPIFRPELRARIITPKFKPKIFVR